ncbi:MAG: flagellar export chaperone FliS [Nitrospirota bacterium]|nr:flagellar export chaperone FliS [Nitrospirota bacterium]
MNEGINQYRRTQILTASEIQVIVLLYDGALNSLELAREGILQNNYADKARFLGRAVAIVSELSNVLDMEQGQDIALSLRRLYNYMLDEMTQANLRHNVRHLDGPIRCLSTLREGWHTIAQQRTMAGTAVGS